MGKRYRRSSRKSLFPRGFPSGRSASYRVVALGLMLVLGLIFGPETIKQFLDAAAPKGIGALTRQGSLEAIDGDSLRDRKTRSEIRLYGIDAPEYHQTCTDQFGKSYPCGQRAAEHLKELIGSATPSCTLLDRDQYGRFIGRCSADGRELNRLMVRDGWAVAYTAFSREYVPEEREARGENRGIWAGTFDPPHVWRKTHTRR